MEISVVYNIFNGMQLIIFFALVCLHFCFVSCVSCVFQLFGEGVRLTYVKAHLLSTAAVSECSRNAA